MLKLIASRETGVDDPLTLRRIETTRRAVSLELSRHRDVERVHYTGINSLDIDTSESRYLLSGTLGGTLHIHDLANFTGSVKFTAKSVFGISRSNKYKHKNSVETVQWYPLDTGIFTSSGTDRILKIWDTNNMIPADEFEFSGIVYSHHMSTVSTKHCLVAVGCHSSTLKLVDLKCGSATHMLKGHKSSILCVKWSTKDEFLLASGSEDNRVLLWDIRSAKGPMNSLDQYNGEEAAMHLNVCTAHSGYVNGLNFTSDGLHLVTFGTDDRIRLWNTSSGKNTLVNYGKISNDCQRAIQFGVSSGSRLDAIYVPEDGNIQVFDMFHGTKLDTLRGHYTQVGCCIFHHDFQELYSGGSDRNVLVWTPETDSAYDEHLRLQNKKSKEQKSFVRRIAASATADTWSSDEDG